MTRRWPTIQKEFNELQESITEVEDYNVMLDVKLGRSKKTLEQLKSKAGRL